MAYLQSELPPSTAPVGVRRSTISAALAKPARPTPSWLVRLAPWLAVAALLLIPGYAAARATESIAMGILAGDLAFLLAVASWSAVAAGARR